MKSNKAMWTAMLQVVTIIAAAVLLVIMVLAAPEQSGADGHAGSPAQSAS
ncbi:hypothetical protein [Gordonia zhaorongruii]|nr:hypothetical protein [Gordonia zhaorongruii]